MSSNVKRLGTFEGVFTPTILTILGVIMYLRLGWVVGNAGFGGALMIILLAKVVTVSTGLSIASIATNTRVGAGGSYALISRSLGLEIGSAIGIPLYLSQALGGALYISGFTEGWLAIFPQHIPLLVSTTVLLILLVVSIVGAKFAMKAQFIIMAVIIASLVSFFAGEGGNEATIRLWGEFDKAPFWVVFAIFFPAVTGIEAGAAMSGDLKDSRKSLPTGILAAIGISLIVYIVVAYWLNHAATSEELMANYTVMADVSRWKPVVIAGILGATLSSALGAVLGAPRTLMALGQDKVLPFSKIISRKNRNGEPITATFITTFAILISLVFGDLDTIAPLLTMFFLITYGTINLAVAIEKGIGIPSFRPAFTVPIIIPIIGGLWSFAIMFLINPVFATIAILLIIVFYIFQVKRGLRTPWGDVRGGAFLAISEWAAKTAAQMPKHAKTWKPNMMILVENPKNWVHLIEFINDLIFPSGTLRVFSLKISEHGILKGLDSLRNRLFKNSKHARETEIHEPTADELEKQIEDLMAPLKKNGIFASGTVIESNNMLEGISIVTQVMKGMYFPPNIYFLTMSSDRSKDERLEHMISIGIREALGICIFSLHPKNSLGVESTINVWLRRTSPNKDLAILLAIQLHRNWNGLIRFVTVEDDEENRDKSLILFEKLSEKARFPANTEVEVIIGEFKPSLINAPQADINLFGMSSELDCNTMHEFVELIGTSCMFLKDSGEESMLV
ncbi:MAG: Na-K-Cl cotransporter [Candidatus Marinimicrobia bacterium]|nr:Na-K-Cl cotransporter [Candidatus Neomarinimicrobiota bacterium]